MENIFEVELRCDFPRRDRFTLCIRTAGYDHEGRRTPLTSVRCSLDTVRLQYPPCHQATLSLHITPDMPPRGGDTRDFYVEMTIFCNGENIGDRTLRISPLGGFAANGILLARP